MICGFLWITNQDELNDCFSIRKKVFIDEQGYEEEFDDIDTVAHHILFLDDETPVGTSRLFIKDDMWCIGRVCTLPEYRGKGVGKFMIEECVKKAKELGVSNTIILGSQMHAKGFYKKLGFSEYGDTYYEENRPHIMMKMDI